MKRLRNSWHISWRQREREREREGELSVAGKKGADSVMDSIKGVEGATEGSP